jgi:hypothetical protein
VDAQHLWSFNHSALNTRGEAPSGTVSNARSVQMVLQSRYENLARKGKGKGGAPGSAFGRGDAGSGPPLRQHSRRARSLRASL